MLSGYNIFFLHACMLILFLACNFFQNQEYMRPSRTKGKTVLLSLTVAMLEVTNVPLYMSPGVPPFIKHQHKRTNHRTYHSIKPCSAPHML
jgi:hypothetical protein